MGALTDSAEKSCGSMSNKKPEIARFTLKLLKKIGGILLRQCCSNHLQRNPIMINGGGGFNVQINQSMFHHEQWAHVGRVALRGVWVYGLVDTHYDPARPYMEIVPNRQRPTRLSILQSKPKSSLPQSVQDTFRLWCIS